MYRADHYNIDYIIEPNDSPPPCLVITIEYMRLKEFMVRIYAVKYQQGSQNYKIYVQQYISICVDKTLDHPASKTIDYYHKLPATSSSITINKQKISLVIAHLSFAVRYYFAHFLRFLALLNIFRRYKRV